MQFKIRKIWSFLKNRKVFKARCPGVRISWTYQFKNPQYCNIQPGVVLGSRCKLLIWDRYTSEEGEKNWNPSLSIGKNFRVTRDLTIQCAGNIAIGDNVLVASNVFMIDYNHGMSPKTASYLDNPLSISEIVIEDGCWIGNNVIVLPGVHIGEKAIIGAGSVVTRDIP